MVGWLVPYSLVRVKLRFLIFPVHAPVVLPVVIRVFDFECQSADPFKPKEPEGKLITNHYGGLNDHGK